MLLCYVKSQLAHAKNSIAKFIQSTSTKSYTKYDTISAYDMRLECVITRKTTSTYLLPVGRYIGRDICRNKPQNIHKISMCKQYWRRRDIGGQINLHVQTCNCDGLSVILRQKIAR